MLHHTNLTALPKRKAEFIEPMDCAPVPKLIDGPGWVYEIKLDRYRAVGVAMRLASTGGRRSNRIPGVDRGRSAQAFEVCWTA